MERKWTKKDGTKVWIRDMDDDHLLNTLKMLQRYAWNEFDVAGKRISRWLAGTMSESTEDSLERELHTPWTRYIPDAYWTLLAYARKRKFWTDELESRFRLYTATDWHEETSPPYWSKRSVWEGVAPEDIMKMEIENAG